MTKRLSAWICLMVVASSLVASAADKPKPKKKGTSNAPASTAPVTPPTDTLAKDADAPRTDDPSAKKDDPSVKKDEEADRKVDFSGSWTWTFTNPNNGFVHEPTLKIKQQGSRIAGIIMGKRGGSLPVRDVRITKDSKVAFTLDREFYGYPMEVKFIGNLQKDTIAGKMGVFINGNTRVFDWTARRVREGAPAPGDPSTMPTANNPNAPRL